MIRDGTVTNLTEYSYAPRFPSFPRFSASKLLGITWAFEVIVCGAASEGQLSVFDWAATFHSRLQQRALRTLTLSLFPFHKPEQPKVASLSL
jgi:hypothetical protein